MLGTPTRSSDRLALIELINREPIQFASKSNAGADRLPQNDRIGLHFDAYTRVCPSPRWHGPCVTVADAASRALCRESDSLSESGRLRRSERDERAREERCAAVFFSKPGHKGCVRSHHRAIDAASAVLFSITWVERVDSGVSVDMYAASCPTVDRPFAQSRCWAAGRPRTRLRSPGHDHDRILHHSHTD